MTTKATKDSQSVSRFMRHHFLHFNAGALLQAAQSLEKHLNKGGRVVLSLAGAMSTAQIGKIVSQAIRQDLIHAVVSTGANLEEDYFQLVAPHKFMRIPHFRELSVADDEQLRDRGLNRITDVAIPEAVIEVTCNEFIRCVVELQAAGRTPFPHEVFLKLAARRGSVPDANSWLHAAGQHNIPIFVPGWEDSSVANAFTAQVEAGKLREDAVRGGIAYFQAYSKWYHGIHEPLGLIQVGGGIAGDFASSVAAYAATELKSGHLPWAYYCQISDSTTSYGSYSGAPPNEKITWQKLVRQTERFMIESDATIVLPLLLQYALEGYAPTQEPQEGGNAQ